MAASDHKSDNQPEGSWNYRPEGAASPVSMASGPGAPANTVAPADGDVLEWTASEFIAHEKSISWYLILGAGTVIATGALFLLTRDFVSCVVVVILAIILGVAAGRKPRIVAYRLDRGGLTVGQRFHPYGNFKSFAIVQEGAFASVTLIPLKRFNLPLSLYFSPENEREIMDRLSRHLPLQPGQLDSIDRLMRNLHF